MRSYEDRLRTDHDRLLAACRRWTGAHLDHRLRVVDHRGRLNGSHLTPAQSRQYAELLRLDRLIAATWPEE